VPFDVQIDVDRGLIRVKYIEPYTFDEWLEGAAKFRSDRSAPFDKRYGFLIDRTAVGEMPASFMSKIAQYVAASASTVKQRRVAIVVQHEGVQTAMLQAMMYEEAGATVGVFTSASEAEAWLTER